MLPEKAEFKGRSYRHFDEETFLLCIYSRLCLKRTSVLSGQIFWSRQTFPLFQYNILCLKRTSVLCGQRTDYLNIWQDSLS